MFREFRPALEAGYRPPLAEGFSRFLASPEAAELLPRLRETEALEQGNLYDTHPPLHARIAALERLQVNERPEDRSPAIGLLTDPDALESGLLADQPGRRRVWALKAVAWGEVMARVHLPKWRNIAARVAPALRGVTCGGLPALAEHPVDFLAVLRKNEGAVNNPEAELQRAGFLVGVCMMAALERAGWQIETDVGHPITARKDGRQISVLDAFPRLLGKARDVPGWQAMCREAGIESLRLDNPPTIG